MLSLLPLIVYLVAGALIVRSVRAHAGSRPLGALIATAVGVATHAFLVFRSIETPQGLSIAITDSASLVGFVIALSTLVLMLLSDVAALPSVLLAVAGLLAVGTGVLAGFAEGHATQWEITAHIGFAALAAGWLSIAAVVVLLLAWQDMRLRSRAPLGVLALLPPIETLEATLFRMVGAGFAVLTLVLVTGMFFVTDLYAQHLVHKVTLAVIAWLVFGVLLFGRYRYGWRGRRALRFTTAGFVILALAYFGSKFVLENLLGRHWG